MIKLINHVFHQIQDKYMYQNAINILMIYAHHRYHSENSRQKWLLICNFH